MRGLENRKNETAILLNAVLQRHGIRRFEVGGRRWLLVKGFGCL